MKFSFSQIDPGLFQIEKHYVTSAAGHGSDVTGPYWMLIEIEVLSGRIFWISDAQEKAPREPRFFLFLPPFSWAMEHYAKHTELKVRGLISKTAVAHAPFAGAVLFQSRQRLPKKWSQVAEFLGGVKQFERIDACTRPSALSKRAKSLLDQGYSSKIEIKEIARKLKTQPATLSRAFKADFGETPAYYRKGLRVTVGMHELMIGAAPAEAAARAGYRDLGRFYKQFKAYLKQTPAQYLEKSKNAKKRGSVRST